VPGVLQLVAPPVAQEKRAQRFARTLAAGVSADNELRALDSLDLDPGLRSSPGLIRAVVALADDAFKAVLQRRRIELFRVVGRMHELDVRRRQQALRQVSTPVDVRTAAEIEPLEMQQVEAHEHHDRLALCLRDFFGAFQAGPVLQRVERRPSLAIERDQFTVEKHVIDRLSGEFSRDLRERRGQVHAAS
jgi:hypothetical protein